MNTRGNCGTLFALPVLCLVLTGCSSQVQTSSEPCATIVIEQTSEDANNAFETLSANQCDINFEEDEGEITLVIDMLDRSTGNINPRVLLTIPVNSADFPIDSPISLTRADNIALAPGIYQEFNNADNSGPFWSSPLQSSETGTGVLMFSVGDDGLVRGEFSFDADNPSTLNNSAEGNVFINGSVTVQDASDDEAANTCGLGSSSMAMLMMLGLALMGTRFRRR